MDFQNKNMKTKKIIGIVSSGAVLSVSLLVFFSSSSIPPNTSIGSVAVGGLSLEKARNVLEQRMEKNRVILHLGDKKVNASYKELGISIDIERPLALLKAGSRFGMASLFPRKETKQKLSPAVDIDEKLLKQAILTFFSFLKTSEEVEHEFFVASERQRREAFTFNFPKLVRQLAYDSKRLRGSNIEIEILPEDYFEEPTKTPEEIELLKKELSEKALVLRIEDDDVAKFEWKIDLKEPGWIAETKNGVLLNEELLRNFFIQNIVDRVERPVQYAAIKNFVDQGKAVRAIASGVARDGLSLPLDENIKHIQKAVSDGQFEIFLQIDRMTAFIENQTNFDLGNLELLSTGRSNFAGSPENRIFNIQKGLRGKMNNIIIPPGAEFAFNSFLDGPVTNKAGWKNALGIFGGGTLRQTPGAGLCQVSTTLYRAILNAGLPIVSRRSHSLYVKYYKEYGEGLDATIFPGVQDLVFKNDTPSYLFIQAYDDGDDAYFKIYGTSDGRTSFLEGPYRTADIPKEKIEKGNYVPRRNEIVWFRTIRRADGTTLEELIISRYKTLPSGI